MHIMELEDIKRNRTEILSKQNDRFIKIMPSVKTPMLTLLALILLINMT